MLHIDINVNTIVDGTIKFAQKYSTSGVRNVDLSSIFLKLQCKLTKEMRQVNDLLKRKCKENNFHFVCIDNVTREQLSRDAIHLNNEGTCIFAGNLVDYLNGFILSKTIWLSNLEISKKPASSLKKCLKKFQEAPPTKVSDQETFKDNSSYPEDKYPSLLSELRIENVNRDW